MLHTAPDTPQLPQGRPKFYHSLYFQVIVAIIIGIILGNFFPHFGASLKPLGEAFIKLVKMIIAPVIFLTVVTGIAGMNDMKSVGRVAGKAMLYFITFSTLASLKFAFISSSTREATGL